MSRNIEQLYAAFNERATKMSGDYLAEFEEAAKRLDRQKDNNVFLMLLGKYARAFKVQLDSHAMFLLENNRSVPNVSQLHKGLTSRIDTWVNEFITRSQGF